MEYEAVIGLEVHVQLKTRAKMFAQVPQGFGADPNTLIDPVVLGLPGSLPVLNKGAIEQAIRFGLVFGAEIPEMFRWDRKNYFYPDSPKNYQLTQNGMPVCVGGEVEIELAGPSRSEMGEHRRIRLNHAHLEEDVGKLTHFEKDSIVDYNRAGTPLLEIVTEPDLKSADEAVALLQSIRLHLVEAGISDCDMEKGQMRCDANVSVRPKDSSELRNRAEMKNLNSITGVRDAIQYEIRRQTKAYDRGESLPQETRRWDADAGMTSSMRTKEDAHDYRYFPDPDLLPVRFPRERVEQLKTELPEPVFARQKRYAESYGFPYSLTSVICYDHELTGFFEAALKAYGKNPKAIANYVANELQRERAAAVEEGLLPMPEVKISPPALAGLVEVIDKGRITKQMAKDVFIRMFKTGESAAAIMKAERLEVSRADDELENLCREILATNQKAVQQVREGEEKALNTFIGPVMKATQGKADPNAVRQTLKKVILE